MLFAFEYVPLYICMMFIIWKLFVSILSFEYDCQVSFNYPLNELQFQLRIILKKSKDVRLT